jgi:23S rRNA (cytosine1962-C5)-methyltransferase
MSSLPIITLAPDRHARLRAGHPWVYSNEVVMDAAAKALPAGTLVRLSASNGHKLGTALFNPHTLVAARVVSCDDIAALDAPFLTARLRHALALRETLFDAPYYRLVHAEADGLPGTVIDRYGDVIVVQLNTAGMAEHQSALLDALEDVLSPRAIVLRNDTAARGTEGLDEEVLVARGALDGPFDIIENGCRFQVDVLGGQKTGWFFDQRDNRAAVAHLARGKTVLDIFCYGGGFGIQAGVAGAASVLLADSSKPALDKAMTSAGHNGIAAIVSTAPGDAFRTLDRLESLGERFGIVVADPPAFAKSRKDVPAALQAYRKLARQAAKLVAPGGFLFIASCSHNIETDHFAEAIRGGLSRAERNGRILRSSGAAADHPVHPFLPESAYLKAMLLQLD